MKYECGSCKDLMALEEVDGQTDNTLRIAFRCPKCGHRIFLIANPQEAQLVRSMGITLGGKEGHRPLELVRSTLKGIREGPSPLKDDSAGNDEQQDSPVWDVEAEQRLDRAPAPVRHMARAAIEHYARQKGYRRITLELVAEARDHLGL